MTAVSLSSFPRPGPAEEMPRREEAAAVPVPKLSTPYLNRETGDTGVMVPAGDLFARCEIFPCPAQEEEKAN